MDIESIQKELRSAFPNSEVVVFSEGNLLKLNIEAEEFKNISKVKRQQMIYAVINHRIKTGEASPVLIR